MASTVSTGVPTQITDTSVMLTPRQYSHASLENLSTEILFLIAGYLVSDVEAKFHGEQRQCSLGTLNSTPQHPQVITGLDASDYNDGVQFNVKLYQDDLTSSLIGLRSLASTSCRFQTIAQPLLFKTPTLSIGRHGRWDENSSIYLFARTLLENPNMAKWPTTLRIDMPESWGGSMETRTSQPLEVLRMASALIDSLDWMQYEHKTMWKWQLQQLRPYPFCAVILSLLPNLTSIYLANPKSQDDLFSDIFWSSSAHVMTEEELEDALASVVECPGLRKLKHYRTDSMVPLLQLPLKAISSLESLDLTAQSSGCAEFSRPYGLLPRIKSLRVDSKNLDMRPRRLQSLLRYFPNIETLDLHPTGEGCRASFATLMRCRGVAASRPRCGN
jgi:hypothetical protein